MLVERERPLALLRDALAQVVDGRGGQLVVLEGPAGIGKTSLLASLRDAAAGVTLQARGAEFETSLLFGTVGALLDSAGHGLDLATPAHPAAAGDVAGALDERLATMQAVQRRLADLAAAHGPLVLLVDDVHWADTASLQTLAYVGRRLDALPALLVVASRPAERESDEARVALSQLLGHPQARRVVLAPLSPRGTGALLSATVGEAVAADAVAACHQATGGNPLLVSELVREVLQDGRTLTAAGFTALADAAPASLVRSVATRLGGLPPDAARLARALAVLGEEHRPGVVAATTLLESDWLSAAVRRLTGAGVLAPGTLAFAHPLLRAAVAGDVDPVAAADLHERAYLARRAAGDPADRLAAHLVHAPPRGDAERVAVLAGAARRASATGAYRLAAAWTARALAEPPPVGERPALLLALGRDELAAGRAEHAAAHLRAALPGLPRDDVAGATALLARALVAAGEVRAAIAAIDAVAAGLDAEAALGLDVERTTLGLYMPELARAAQARMRAYADLGGVTPGQRVALANAALAEAFAPEGTCARATELSLRALAGGRLVEEAGSEAPVTGQALYPLLFGPELDLVEGIVLQLRADAERRRSTLGMATRWLGAVQVALLRGQVDAARTAGEAGLALLADVPRSPIVARWRVGLVRFTVEALVECDGLDAADALLAEAAAGADLDAPEHALLRFGLGLAAAARGDHEQALAQLRGYGRTAARVGYEERTTAWRLEAALAARQSGDAQAAQALAREQLALAGRWGYAPGRGAALRVHALVGPHRLRLPRLQEAEALLRDSPHRLVHARVLLDLGVATAATGAGERGRALLTESLDLAAAGGAARVRDQARAALLAAGSRPRRDRTTGPDALTPAEQRVAALVVTGLSNRAIAGQLFVSPRTVESQLTTIFRKLDVAGRGELAAALEPDGPEALGAVGRPAC